MKLINLLRTNWVATCRLNYNAGGWSFVVRMPIRVYGKLKLTLKGKVVLPTDAMRNTVIINADFEDYTASSGKAEVRILGTWKIGGFLRIGPDSCISVHDGASLTFGNNIYIARDVRILCCNHIEIGSNVLVGCKCITDSTHHPIIKDEVEQPMLGEVVVGDDVYLSYDSLLLKGTVIPPGSIVGSSSVCTSDYSKSGAEKLLICGCPAKVKATNVTAKF